MLDDNDGALGVAPDARAVLTPEASCPAAASAATAAPAARPARFATILGEGAAASAGTGAESDAGRLAADAGSVSADRQGPPATYDLRTPEGMTADAAQLELYAAQARELGLGQEQAQKLLELSHANREAMWRQHAAQVDDWAEEVRQDKELGGARYEATRMHAVAGLKAHDPDGTLYALLEESGYGNHPEVIRFLSRISRARGEDSVITGTSRPEDVPLEERLYPHWKP